MAVYSNIGLYCARVASKLPSVGGADAHCTPIVSEAMNFHTNPLKFHVYTLDKALAPVSQQWPRSHIPPASISSMFHTWLQR